MVAIVEIEADAGVGRGAVGYPACHHEADHGRGTELETLDRDWALKCNHAL